MKSILIEACLAGGETMKEYAQQSYRISNKDVDGSLVTEADKESEKVILKHISTAFPEHDILSEETPFQKKTSDYRWIVDPIDGTTNFFHNNPLCCVSVALEYKQQLQLACVYNPFMDELFFAERGKGASLNEKKIHTPQIEKSIQNAIVVFYPNRHKNDSSVHPNYQKLYDQRIHSRKTGSSAIDLCWVAMGRFYGFISAYPINVWDIAAGILILEESGALIYNLTQQKFRLSDTSLITGNQYFVNHFFNSSH